MTAAGERIILYGLVSGATARGERLFLVDGHDTSREIHIL